MTASITDIDIAPWQDRAQPWVGALHEAIKLAARGLPVFPCGADKTPRCKGGFKAATKDPDALRKLWWRECVLVGVPTGAVSNIFCVDVDSARHNEAADWLERYSPYLPETRLHQTQSGGTHLIFQHRPGLKSTASKLAHGVDTRGDGGFIIWWPAHLGLAAHHKFLPLAPLPEWLAEALTPPPRQPLVPQPLAPCRRGTSDSDARLSGLVGVVATAREGERNKLLFWSACRVADMLAMGELEPGAGPDALRALAEAASRNGLSFQEIEGVFKSAAKNA